MRRVHRIAAGPQIYYSILSDKLPQKLMDNNLNRDVDTHTRGRINRFEEEYVVACSDTK